MTQKDWQEASGEKITVETFKARLNDLLAKATASGVTLDQQEDELAMVLEDVSNRKHAT